MLVFLILLKVSFVVKKPQNLEPLQFVYFFILIEVVVKMRGVIHYFLISKKMLTVGLGN